MLRRVNAENKFQIKSRFQVNKSNSILHTCASLILNIYKRKMNNPIKMAFNKISFVMTKKDKLRDVSMMIIKSNAVIMRMISSNKLR